MIKKCVNQHYYDGDKFPNCPFCGGADITNGSTAAQNPSVLPQLDSNDEETLPLAFYQKSRPQTAPADTAEPLPSAIPAPIQTPVGNVSYNKLLPPMPRYEEDVPAAPSVPVMSPIEDEPTVPSAPVMPPMDDEPTVPCAPVMSSIEDEPTVPSAPVMPPMDDEPTVPCAPVVPPTVQHTVAAEEKPMQDMPFSWLVALNGTAYGESFVLQGGQSVIGCMPTITITVWDGNGMMPHGDAVICYAEQDKAWYIMPVSAERVVMVNEQAVTEKRALAAYDAVKIGETKLLFFPLPAQA